jgi:site-specific DNA-methyltransferase (adenine-specific)
MLGLEPGSVDLVLCDLPSGETAAKFDVKVSLPDFWRASWQCLKPTGIVCVMASSFRFADEVYQSQSKAFRYDMVWSKSIATGFMNKDTRPLRAHEFILTFWQHPGTYNIEMTETGVPIASNKRVNLAAGAHGENYGSAGGDAGLSRAGATDRFPRSVLDYPCLGVRHPDRVHPQQKPDDLFRRLIRMYSNPGELCVDPCAGSGTTERAALAEGRRAICWDIQERFGKRKGEQLLIGQDRA